jgi:hypothetical protein
MAFLHNNLYKGLRYRQYGRQRISQERCLQVPPGYSPVVFALLKELHLHLFEALRHISVFVLTQQIFVSGLFWFQGGPTEKEEGA